MRRACLMPFGCLTVLWACLAVSAVRADETPRDGGKPVSFWDQKESILALAFSPDGKILATGGGNLNGYAALWDVATLTRKAILADAGMVSDIAFAPDGKWLATVGQVPLGERLTRPALILWDAATGRKRLELDAGKRGARHLAFSPDSRLLAVAGNTAITLWETASGKERAALKGHTEAPWGLAFSPDGKTLASAGGRDETIRLWDVAGSKERAVLRGHRFAVATVLFSPDGKSLISGGGPGHDEPGELFVWDLAAKTVKARWKGHDGPVVSLAFSGDGRTLASASRFHDVVKLCDWPAGKQRMTLEGPGNLNCVAFSPDGKLLVVTGGTGDPILSSGGVRLWDLTSGREKLSPAREKERARREAELKEQQQRHARARAERARLRREAERRLGPEGRALFDDGGRVRRTEHALKVQQAEKALTRWEFRQARSLLDELKPCPGEEDLRGFEWHLLRARLPREVVIRDNEEKPNKVAAAVAPDGRTVAVAGENHTITLYDVKTRSPRAVLKGHKTWAAVLAFSPDSRVFASAESDPNGRPCAIKLWDAARGKELVTLVGHKDGIEALAFSADGHLLASASRDQTVKLWDLRRRKLAHSLEGHQWITAAVAFSPDGKTVASGAVFDGARLWDVETGKQKTVLPHEHREHIAVVLFSSDGRSVLTAGERVRVWDVASGKLVRELSLLGLGPVLFAPDGRSLLCGLTRVDAVTGEVLAEYEQRPNRSLLNQRGEHARAVTLSETGSALIVTADREHIRLLDIPLDTGRCGLRTGDNLSELAFSSDGKDLIGLGTGRSVRRWDATTGRPHPGNAQARDAEVDVIFPEKGPARVQVGREELPLADFVALGGNATLGGRGDPEVFLALSPNGRVLVTAADKTVRLRDADTGRARVTLPNFGRYVSGYNVTFSPDGKGFVTWLDDVVRWDVSTGKELERIQLPGFVSAVRFAPDGRTLTTLLVSLDRTPALHLWDVATGEVRASLRGHTASPLAGAIVFSPDGRTLATAGEDRTVRLWDAVSGHPRGVLYGHPERITRLAFRPDGKALAAGSFGGAVSLWAVNGAEHRK